MTPFQTLVKTLNTTQKTWLVTGNAGFIGSNLVEFLLTKNQKVIRLDNFATGQQHNIDDVLTSVGKEAAQNFTFIKGDIADIKTCQNACQGVDIIPQSRRTHRQRTFTLRRDEKNQRTVR